MQGSSHREKKLFKVVEVEAGQDQWLLLLRLTSLCDSLILSWFRRSLGHHWHQHTAMLVLQHPTHCALMQGHTDLIVTVSVFIIFQFLCQSGRSELASLAYWAMQMMDLIYCNTAITPRNSHAFLWVMGAFWWVSLHKMGHSWLSNLWRLLFKHQQLIVSSGSGSLWISLWKLMHSLVLGWGSRWQQTFLGPRW